jgi:UDP-N-acetylmuramyl tripeptide synthase
MRDNTRMGLLDRLVIISCKLISWVSTTLRLGAGATWPGEIALMLRPKIATPLTTHIPLIILVAGTNGKTTTSLMIKTILEKEGMVVVHNKSGANLLNGIVSASILEANWLGDLQADAAVFEIDENSLPVVLKYVQPTTVALLNLFRDQLDRYGEVDIIVEKWLHALGLLSEDVTVVLNSDDPGISHLARVVKGKKLYFGINDTRHFLNVREHATDSTFCPNCGSRLSYDGIFYSHIGHWRCRQCDNKRTKPTIHTWKSPLDGLYNQYNTLAAVAAAKSVNIKDETITTALSYFAPAFGRQEAFDIQGTKVKIFLSKNPAGFNASLRTVLDLKGQDVLIVLNDRIPDGRDVSWIWDVDFEMISDKTRITVSGDRTYDLALRMQYADKKAEALENLERALQSSIKNTPKDKTLFVLATYSAMLDVRKILTGRKIL